MLVKNPARASLMDIVCKLLQIRRKSIDFLLRTAAYGQFVKKHDLTSGDPETDVSTKTSTSICSHQYTFSKLCKSEKIKHRMWSRVTSAARKRRFRLGLSNATRSMDRSKFPPRHTLSQIVMVITAVSQFYLLSNLGYIRK